MSNLIKSGFVAFSKDEKIIIDANKNKIIEGIDANARVLGEQSASVEDALAAAMIEDVGLYADGEDGDGVLTFETPMFDQINDLSGEEADQKASDIIREANQEAELIVNNAHDEAEKIRASLFEEAQSIKKQSEEEGYSVGYEKGTAQAQLEIEEMKRSLEKQMEESKQQLLDEKEQLLIDTEQKMVEWLCQMIPKIVGVSIENQEAVLLYMINNAMRELENSNRYIIRVSSFDYDMISSRKNDIYGALNPSVEMEIFEDAKLQEHQCQIDTDNGIVDLSLDVQMDNLLKALRLMS